MSPPLQPARASAIRAVAAALGRLPGRCALCRDWCAARLCEACITRFAPVRPRCARCARPLGLAAAACGACLARPPAAARTLVAVDYGPPWDALVSGLKFHQRLDLAPALAGLLRRALGPRQADEGAWPTLLLPVPLGPQRLRERGYNQAWELARRLAPLLGLPARGDVLLRLRDTAPQTNLPRAQRLRNLQAAFLVEPSLAPALHGRHLALVDDVTTTGATADAAINALKAAGAASVELWALARTPMPEDG